MLEAATELLSRQTARRSIDELARRLLALEPAAHHQFVNALLEKVEAGEIKRLMLFEPPGHAKSTYASVLFPGYYIGRNPDKQLIAGSHTQDLAAGFGRRVRNLFGALEWPFETALAGDSQAADQWSTTKGGGYYAVPVGGAVHGRRWQHQFGAGHVLPCHWSGYVQGYEGRNCPPEHAAYESAETSLVSISNAGWRSLPMLIRGTGRVLRRVGADAQHLEACAPRVSGVPKAGQGDSGHRCHSF